MIEQAPRPSGIDESTHTATIIYNPFAGRGKTLRVDAVASLLELNGFAVDTKTTKNPGDEITLTRKALQENPTAILLAGGDGTINKGLDAMVGEETTSAIAILPNGTGNVLAKDLGIPNDPQGIVRTITHGVVERMDVGELQTVDATGNGHRHVVGAFLGIGADGEVVHAVHYPVRRRGELVYIQEMLKKIPPYQKTPARVTLGEEGEADLNLLLGVIMNGRRYTKYLTPNPHGKMNDGAFDSRFFLGEQGTSLFDHLIFNKVTRGRQLPDVRQGRSGTFTVEMAHAVRGQVDGDPLPPTEKFSLVVKPQAVPIFVARSPHRLFPQ